MHINCILIQFQVEFFDGFVGRVTDDRWYTFVREVIRNFGVGGGSHDAFEVTVR